MDVMEAVITNKLDQVLEKLNSLPDLISQTVEQALAKYLISDEEQPEPAAPAEPSEEDKARDAIVSDRVKDLGEQIRGWLPEKPGRLSWTQLIHVIVYQELSGTRVWSNWSPSSAGMEKQFVETAVLRAQAIVEKYKTVSSDEVMKFLESQK